MIVERRVCDLTGAFPAEQVTFQLDKRQYEIDLAPALAAALRAKLEPFIDAASRRYGSPRGAHRVTVKRGPAAPQPAPQPPAVPEVPQRELTGKQAAQAARAWARAQEPPMPVNSRGSVSVAAMEAWRAAGSPIPEGVAQ